MFSLILLSAGMSSRFGSPKALAPWGQQPLIAYLLGALVETNLDEIVVVLGADADLIEPFLLKHNKIKVVYNKDYKFGQTSSFKAGLAAVSSGVKAVGLLPVDTPLLKIPTVNVIIDELIQTDPLILIPAYQGEKGHPPFFSSKLQMEFLGLPNDVGLNTISRRYEKEVRLFEVDDEGVLLSFNTPEELQNLRNKLT
ncbi:MAG: nucleotidyltransferase family protein [Candidatus Omnitrophica bacterium]|nr:nucleotidyltransferase family protein [Candidatus Omnitrophota bacterium]